MNDTNKDYKRMWFTYKQALLDEFKSMCKEAVYITAELGALKDMPIQNTVLKERKKYRLSNHKLQWQSALNILMLIDRIDDTPTVANLSEVYIYKEAFEIFGIKGYDYYKLPINQFIAETRAYKDKWKELRGILMQLVKQTDKHTLIKKEVLHYMERQLATVINIEDIY